jgi:hypothetical protein
VPSKIFGEVPDLLVKTSVCAVMSNPAEVANTRLTLEGFYVAHGTSLMGIIDEDCPNYILTVRTLEDGPINTLFDGTEDLARSSILRGNLLIDTHLWNIEAKFTGVFYLAYQIDKNVLMVENVSDIRIHDLSSLSIEERNKLRYKRVD